MMRGATKMLMVSGRVGKDDMRYPDMNDRRENGNYDAHKASRGTLTWDNTRGAESAYRGDYGGKNYPRHEDYPRSEMEEPESRRRRDSRGRFRSEMDEPHNARYPMYPPPVYEEYSRPNQIGFSAHGNEQKEGLHMIRGGASQGDMGLDEETAYEWMESLQNEDGTTGPHWTKEQTTQAMKQKGINCDPLEFWVAMNAVYSDYYGVAKRINANNVDFYVYMAKAFIDDKDSQPNRLARYYKYVAKH